MIRQCTTTRFPSTTRRRPRVSPSFHETSAAPRPLLWAATPLRSFRFCLSASGAIGPPARPTLLSLEFGTVWSDRSQTKKRRQTPPEKPLRSGLAASPFSAGPETPRRPGGAPSLPNKCGLFFVPPTREEPPADQERSCSPLPRRPLIELAEAQRHGGAHQACAMMCVLFILFPPEREREAPQSSVLRRSRTCAPPPPRTPPRTPLRTPPPRTRRGRGAGSSAWCWRRGHPPSPRGW